MRIIKSKKFAESFNELYDYVDDDTVETLDQYEQDDYDVVDYDSLEMGEVPITDDNVDDVLVDNLIDEVGEEEGVSTEEFPLEEVPIEEVPTVIEPLKEVPTEEEALEQETPKAEESVPDPDDDAKKHFGSDIRGALEWAKEKKRVVQIFYNTGGRRKGRGGKEYLKRELNLPKIEGGGVNINRIIEPHYFFHAETTKRDILVTYDRSVRHVRAFIVDNITGYNFTKRRGTDEDQYFGRTNRPGIKVPIDTKPIKGIDKMENINDSLAEMEASLKSKGLVKSASVVKNAEEILKGIKTAQYVGVQGYWIRNRRCWDNCYRQKRTTQPDTPAQEVWMECWEEYKKALNDPKSGWEKYAKKNKDMKISAKKEKQLNKIFASHVSKKVKKGMSTPEAVYTIIGERFNLQRDQILKSASQLMELADTLSSSGEKDLGESLAGISAEVLKEADFTGNPTGGNVGGKGNRIFNPLNWSAPGKRLKQWMGDKWTGKGGKSDVVKKMQDVVDRANKLIRMLNASQKVQVNPTNPTQAGNKSIIIEAGKGSKIVEAVGEDKRRNKQKSRAWKQRQQNPNMQEQSESGYSDYYTQHKQNEAGQELDAMPGRDYALEAQNPEANFTNPPAVAQPGVPVAPAQSAATKQQAIPFTGNQPATAPSTTGKPFSPMQPTDAGTDPLTLQQTTDTPVSNDAGYEEILKSKAPVAAEAIPVEPVAETPAEEIPVQDVPGDGVDTDQGGTDGPDVAAQPTQKAGPREQQQLEYVKKNFSSFMNDVSKLISEFTGFSATGNEEVKNYASQANTVLQKFINNGNQLFSEADNTKKIDILRTSLQDVVGGLQGVISGQPAAPGLDLGMGDAGAGGAGAGDGAGFGAGAGGAGAGGAGNIPFPQQASNPLDKIETMDMATIMPIKQRIDAQFAKLEKEQVAKPMENAAAYNHKLKLMK